MDYRSQIEEWHEQLVAISKEPEPIENSEDVWTTKEILGHLVDSATINLLRIKSICILESPIFTGYNQREFVDQHSYLQMNFDAVLELWHSINSSIVRLIDELSPRQLLKKVPMDVLQTIVFEVPDSLTDANLKYLVSDYFAHLAHHIKQIERNYNA